MSLLGNDEFAVVMFSASHIRGAVFSRNKNALTLSRHAEEPIENSDTTAVWRRVLSRINCNKSMPLFISGSFKGGIFFQTRSVELPVAEQRSSVELELSRHLITIPKDYRLQIMSSDCDDDKVLVNAYIFPAESIGVAAEALSGCNRQTDGFIYPLMACQAGDPMFYNAEIEPGFSFSSGQWRPFSDGGNWQLARKHWAEICSDLFTLPADLDTDAFLPVLQVARLITRRDYNTKKAGLPVLPDNLRPKRIKRQLQLTVTLVIALIALLIWGAFGTWNSSRAEYTKLRDEIKKLSRETVRMQNNARRLNRTNKERSKIVSLKTTEYDVLGFLAAFSSLLPSNVSVNNFRFNESGVDIAMASTAENIDLARILKPMAHWKISQLQQRQNRGGSGTSINLKLVPDTGEVTKKGRRR